MYKKVSLAYIGLSFYINVKIIGHRKINAEFSPKYKYYNISIMTGFK